MRFFKQKAGAELSMSSVVGFDERYPGFRKTVEQWEKILAKECRRCSVYAGGMIHVFEKGKRKVKMPGGMVSLVAYKDKESILPPVMNTLKRMDKWAKKLKDDELYLMINITVAEVK